MTSQQLNPGSRYPQFHGAEANLSDRELIHLTEVDHHDHEALVPQRAATAEIPRVSRFARSADNPSLAEVGIAVVDNAQRRGVGRALVRPLAARAGQEEITT
ncbi:MAG: GNAT family N-acetyltransferase [Solirubrobacteraceae bacterium]